MILGLRDLKRAHAHIREFFIYVQYIETNIQQSQYFIMFQNYSHYYFSIQLFII